MSSPPSWAKWWVLLWYSYVSALQSLLWSKSRRAVGPPPESRGPATVISTPQSFHSVTYSSVPAASNAYLGIDDATLNLLLAYGPIAFCLAVYPAAAILSARPVDGLRLTIRLGAGLCLAAATLRTVPVFIPARADSSDAAAHDTALALTHIAQFINAAVGPLIVASPAVLSRAWFPPAQRNTATAIANTANALGRAVGFFLGPALVSTASQVGGVGGKGRDPGALKPAHARTARPASPVSSPCCSSSRSPSPRCPRSPSSCGCPTLPRRRRSQTEGPRAPSCCSPTTVRRRSTTTARARVLQALLLRRRRVAARQALWLSRLRPACAAPPSASSRSLAEARWPSGARGRACSRQ